MKKLLYVASVVFMAACAGAVDPDDQNPQDAPEEYVGPYTLSADVTEVEASGKDSVSFTLTDAYGRDILLDKKALQSVNIISEQGQRVKRMETKTCFIANGTYNFYAKYKGQQSENTVDITAKNRGKYEKYHKNVALYKATATWCGPCALMTQAIAGLNEDTTDHIVELCWHYQDDDLSITLPGSDYDCGTVIASIYGGGGVPTVVLDLVTPVAEKSSSTIESEVWNLRAQHPATCGIKLASKVKSSTGMIDITAELTSSTGGEYDLGLALMLNNQVIPSGTNDGGKYSHIVVAASGNYIMYSTAIQKVEKNGSIAFSQSIPMPSYKEADMSLAAFALVKTEDGARIDNIVEAKLGETKDYVCNE